MEKTSRRSRHCAGLISLIIAAVVVMGTLSPAFAGTYPKAEKYIADEAGVISEVTARTIRNANEELEKNAGAVIAVCTVSTTGDTPIGEYTRAVFHDWKLGESILILIAVDDMNYYFLQSTAIDKILSNEELQSITNDYLEADFVEGNIDTGVMKVCAKLSSVLGSRMNTTDEAADGENKGKTFGSVIAGFFKAILWIVLIAVILFVILFVAALFNDDAAAILRKYVFHSKPQNSVSQIRYDERLYGRQTERRPQQSEQYGRQMPRQQNQNRNYSGARYQGQNSRSNDKYTNYTGYEDYFAQTRNMEEPYYNSDGTRRK